jgi:spermidine synthase
VTRILRTIVEDGSTLALRERNGVLDLVLGNVVLLSSAALETEREFGALAKEAFGAPAPRIVIGGLGFGSTLRGVLDVAPPDASIVVCEKLACVVDLARREAKDLVGDAIDDPRVRVERADVLEVIGQAKEKDLAAILLDVDNGPDWASFRTNARLYAAPALAQAKAALRPGGLYAVWSGYPADGFLAPLRRAGFSSRVVPLHERGVVRARAYVGTCRTA